MKSSVAERRTSRCALLLLAAGLTVAACTASSGVSGQQSNTSGTGPVASVTSDEQSDSPTTAITPPDSDGLPIITDIDPDIRSGTLDNGLQYFVRRNDNPGSRVEMRLTINAGSGLQNREQGGGAHFLEHMLFNGTEQFPENELVAVLRSFGAGFGADINAYTTYDETVYELTMPTTNPAVVGTGLDVLQQWLSAATIDAAQVEAERGVVLDEWRGSAESSNGRVSDQIQQFFLDRSPYEGREPIGEDTEISAMVDGPLRAFYDDWYRPDNASVIVVGDIDAANIETQIIDRFSSASARGTSPDRVDLVVDPSTDARAIVFDDPDVSEGFAFVTLPLARDLSGPREAVVQRNVYDGLAFDIIAVRLANDALRGDAPFDDARVDGSGLVRLLDAPEIYVSAHGADVEASAQAVLDEYERVRRFGFTQSEVDRAVATRRASAQLDFDSRFSRQDASYADDYVRHALEGEALPTASRWFEFVSEVLDRATPENLAYMFVDRFERAGAHIFVTAPADEIDDVPSADVFVAQANSVTERNLQARPDAAAVAESLMEAPTAVEEISTVQLADGVDVGFIAPTMLTFDNGVRVVLNTTPIAEGFVSIEGRSPGGTSMLADVDVAAAEAASAVVDLSGLAGFDPVELDAFLADKEVGLDALIDVFTEGFRGGAATTELETLFQLIHLEMTAPRVDQVALDQYVDNELPYAEDPSIDPGYAEFKALTEARYDDPRYLIPDLAALNGLTADDVRRVFVDRFGDASDWVFSLSGDFDLDTGIDLARTYLGTLPATGRVEQSDFVEPPLPAGIVTETVRAGQGDQASVTFLFTAPASTARRDDIAARMVAEIVTARLTEKIREELGESYSPYAALELSGGASPVAELYLSMSTGPELVDSVSAAVLEQLDDLRTNGPTPTELSSAAATVRNEVDLFSNEQINDEILQVLTDPAGNSSIDEFLTQARLVTTITATDVQTFMQRWAPADQYISVFVVPR